MLISKTLENEHFRNPTRIKKKVGSEIVICLGGGVIIESINSVGDQRKVNIGLEKRRGGGLYLETISNSMVHVELIFTSTSFPTVVWHIHC